MASENSLEIFENIAHKIKTPLSVCLLNIELAKQELAEGQYDLVDQILTKSINSIFSLSSSCTDTLNQIRLQNSPNRKELLNLSNLLNLAVEDFKVLLDRQELKHLIEPSVYIFGNSERIREAVLNLLDNSLKFIDSEKGVISVSLSTTRDSCLNNVPDGEICIKIRDNGRGIPKHKLNNIFDRYEQNIVRDGSAGIGLAIVKDIVSDHQGRIEIKSELNKGTLVTIYLPIAASSSYTKK